MIQAMRKYNYYLYGTKNNYGEPMLSAEPNGIVDISINVNTHIMQGSILYSDAQYIGITDDREITDKYVIEYGSIKLKVLNVIPGRRFNQVFLAKM